MIIARKQGGDMTAILRKDFTHRNARAEEKQTALNAPDFLERKTKCRCCGEHRAPLTFKRRGGVLICGVCYA